MVQKLCRAGGENAGNARGKRLEKETDVGLAGESCASLHMQLRVDDVGRLSGPSTILLGNKV